MGSTKFVVVKAKELIRTAVFAVLGVIIIVGLITFFLHMGDNENTGLYRDGTYYGEMEAGGEVAEIEEAESAYKTLGAKCYTFHGTARFKKADILPTLP